MIPRVEIICLKVVSVFLLCAYVHVQMYFALLYATIVFDDDMCTAVKLKFRLLGFSCM